MIAGECGVSTFTVRTALGPAFPSSRAPAAPAAGLPQIRHHATGFEALQACRQVTTRVVQKSDDKPRVVRYAYGIVK